MGLEERRKLQELQDNAIPEQVASIKDDVGIDVALELATETFDLAALNWVEYQGLKYVANMCRIIGNDALGKEALAESLKKARLVNLPNDKAAEKNVKLAGGVLTLSCAWGVGSSDGWIGYDDLAKQVTALL